MTSGHVRFSETIGRIGRGSGRAATRVMRPGWSGRRAGQAAAWLVLFAVVIDTQFAVPYNLFRYEVIVAYAVAALGIYLTQQIAGEFMIGHVAIVSISAYVVAWLNTHTGWGPISILPFALIAGVLVGVLMGLPGLRLGALYLGIISLFPVLILPNLAEAFSSVTGGQYGLTVQSFNIGVNWGALTLYEVALLILLISFVYVRNIVRSSWGTRLKALRDAPQGLAAVGVSRGTTKTCVYALSSVPASLAGWLLAYVNGSVIAGFFGLALTLVLVAAVIIGGRRSVIGVVLAAILLAGYTELIGPFSKYNQLGLGLLLLAVIVIAPSGLDSLQQVRLNRRRQAAGSRLVNSSEAADGPTADVDALLANAHSDRLSAQQGPDSHGDVLLAVKDLSKAFGGNIAIQCVSFEMRARRITGLVGANGSGKTTLINLITGFLGADRGSVEILGKVVSGRAPHRISRAGVSRTFQVPRLIGDLSVRRNIEVGLLASAGDSLLGAIALGGRFGRAVQRRRAAVDEVAKLLGLPAEVLDTPAESLSLGMKRVVEIGRAVASGARVICLDEPAAGLNEPEIKRLELTLTQIADSGCAVLLVEHHMRFVMDVCDDILVLERGSVAGWAENTAGMPLPDALRRHIGVSQ